jgi:hypothetical protein
MGIVRSLLGARRNIIGSNALMWPGYDVRPFQVQVNRLVAPNSLRQTCLRQSALHIAKAALLK